jgi:hypothetical protein
MGVVMMAGLVSDGGFHSRAMTCERNRRVEEWGGAARLM